MVPILYIPYKRSVNSGFAENETPGCLNRGWSARQGVVDGRGPNAQIVKVSIIFDNEIGSFERTRGFDLGRHARAHARFVEVISRHDARDTLLERCDNEDGFIDEPIVARLEEQRHDVHEEAARLRARLAFERQRGECADAAAR